MLIIRRMGLVFCPSSPKKTHLPSHSLHQPFLTKARSRNTVTCITCPCRFATSCAPQKMLSAERLPSWHHRMAQDHQGSPGKMPQVQTSATGPSHAESVSMQQFNRVPAARPAMLCTSHVMNELSSELFRMALACHGLRTTELHHAKESVQLKKVT